MGSLVNLLIVCPLIGLLVGAGAFALMPLVMSKEKAHSKAGWSAAVGALAGVLIGGFFLPPLVSGFAALVGHFTAAGGVRARIGTGSNS